MSDPLQKLADELRWLNRELGDREERLRLAIATGLIGLWEWNSTDTANSGNWSPRMKEIFGLPFDAEVTYELFLQCVHPEDRERVNTAVMNAIDGVNGGNIRKNIAQLVQRMARFIGSRGAPGASWMRKRNLLASSELLWRSASENRSRK